MAITGTFVADFASFQKAVADSEVALRGFEGGAGKVETSLNRMVDSFSGRKIITDATLMAEAVERLGGTSKLTGQELAVVGVTATAAVAKMTALGVDVPPALQRLADSTAGASNAFGTLHGGLSAADKTLAAFGIHLGPEIQALHEMADASGKTATQIGLIGTVSLAAAAAIAGWKIGTLISDFFGLGQAIGNATAKILGFGDVAAETAGAKADVLAKASQTAGRQITDLSEAMRINEAAAKNMAVQTTAAAAEEKRLGEEAAKSRDDFIKDWKDRVEAHNVAHRKIVENNKAIEDSVKRITEAEQAQIAQIANKLFGYDDIERARQYAKAVGDVENISKLNADQQRDFAEVMRKGIEAEIAAGNSTDAFTGHLEVLRLKATQTARDAETAFTKIKTDAAAAAAAIAGVAQLVIVGRTPGAPAAVGAPGSLSQRGNVVFTEGLASGGPVSAGQSYIVGERGPELYTPGANGFISPTGGGTVITNVFQVNGTGEDVGRQAMAYITQTMKNNGRKWPAA